MTSLKKLSWFPPKLPPYNLLQYKERLPADYQLITNHWRHSKKLSWFPPKLPPYNLLQYKERLPADYQLIINHSLKKLSWFPPKLPPYNLLEYKERLPADYQLITNHWRHSKNFLGFHLNFLHITCYNTKKDYLRIINWS